MSPTRASVVPFPNPHSSRNLTARWWPGVRTFPCSPIRIAGMLPVILVLGLHSLAYLTAVPGSLFPLLTRYPILATVLLFLFHFFFLSALTNYLLLVVADPGSPPDDWKAPAPVIAIRTPPPSSPSSSDPTASVQTPSAVNASSDYPLPPVKHGHYIHHFKHAHLMRERTLDGYLRYCDFCRAYKPDRSHHCSVCRRCILRMDHHCVFVNNCVSFYNHKFFVSFVFFAFLGCATTAIVAFPTFADIVAVVPTRHLSLPTHNPTHSHSIIAHVLSFFQRNLFFRHHDPSAMASANFTNRLGINTKNLASLSAASSLSTPLKSIVMVGYITTTAFAFALAVFVSLHIFLISKGRTTIEMYEMADQTRAARVAEYDLGCARNFRNVCGPIVACWPFPTRAYIPGDGLAYERRSDVISGVGIV